MTNNDVSEHTRQQSFDTDGPVEIHLDGGPAQIEIRLTEQPGAHVRLTAEANSSDSLSHDLATMLSWVSSQFNGSQAGIDFSAEAINRTVIDFAENRLHIRTPADPMVRLARFRIEIQAPQDSKITARGGSGDITITGTAGQLNITTGSGRIATDSCTGAATIVSGSGGIRLGAMAAGLDARTSSGDIEVSAIDKTSELATSRGAVWLGKVRADVRVRTGTGDVAVADAMQGRIALKTGSGDIRIGLHTGITAEVDLTSGYGKVRSDLDVQQTAPTKPAQLVVHGRTGYGAIIVSRARP